MVGLQDLRKEVDEVDERIVHLLATRVKVCESIGSAKKERGLRVEDAAREEAVYKRVRKLAMELGLNPLQVELVYREIVNMCRLVQQ